MSILFDNVSFAYPGDTENTVETFAARFDRENINLITGPTGEGKSTLLFLASGLYPSNGGTVKSGKVTVDGEDIGELTPHSRCKKVGIMFQNPDMQFCTDTLRNELIFCLENMAVVKNDFEKIMTEAVGFCDTAHLLDRRLYTLSGGEKQKAALSCLYAMSPDWLLLDEPFANTDSKAAHNILQKLCELHRTKGTGILAVDHRLDYWKGIADKVYMYKDSTVSLTNFPKSFLYEPFPIPCEKGDAVVTAEKLSVSYGKKEVLHNVSFTAGEGEICALVGDSGSGKSSLFAALTGMVKHGGKLTFKNGKRTRLGMLLQNPSDQFVCDTAEEEISLSLKDKAEVEKILKSANLWEKRASSPFILSRGQQRRLLAASLFVHKSDILLCDEPTYAQDRESTVVIMDSLCKFSRKNKTAMIFTTHDYNLAVAYADRIFELKDGALYEKV